MKNGLNKLARIMIEVHMTWHIDVGFVCLLFWKQGKFKNKSDSFFFFVCFYLFHQTKSRNHMIMNSKNENMQLQYFSAWTEFTTLNYKLAILLFCFHKTYDKNWINMCRKMLCPQNIIKSQKPGKTWKPPLPSSLPAHSC